MPKPSRAKLEGKKNPNTHHFCSCPIDQYLVTGLPAPREPGKRIFLLGSRTARRKSVAVGGGRTGKGGPTSNLHRRHSSQRHPHGQRL